MIFFTVFLGVLGFFAALFFLRYIYIVLPVCLVLAGIVVIGVQAIYDHNEKQDQEKINQKHYPPLESHWQPTPSPDIEWARRQADLLENPQGTLGRLENSRED